MQRRRKVVLSTLGVVLITSVFICSWFRPEAVKERNLDFLKHKAAEYIGEQSVDNIFSYEKFESGEYRTYTCNLNDVYISGPILSIVEKNNELLDGGILWVVSVNGEIIGTIEQDAALYSVFLSSQNLNQYILYGSAYILQAISSRKLPAVSYYEYNTEGGGAFLSDNILATFNYGTGEYGFVKAASKFPSASSLITSRLGSEYLDFMANKERVVDLL
ncbi:hypothetical protein Apar_0847 [Lancefieldella parvula DSM 20469]|uniref:Uncharacterized protein n=1 Tax=Lancefieldella parvula (strain ATCC 33793 / DSM 20469 / CCUG 32760 / JCM 10300 / KCTC 3663 / VPI 0546 / 1246) TaxID=521095 RepID=C8W736_LANP1|nr:hypothetical protein [Lancefieldella parvula]ACV51276.1 hypothetical protein Apar_0847 [Lancefieldella parvula DSM 20469]